MQIVDHDTGIENPRMTPIAQLGLFHLRHRRHLWMFFTQSLVIAFMAVMLSGCASHSESRAAGPTGGMDMTLYTRDATGAETYYEVDRHGTLHFGGGMAARLAKTTWSGPLTIEELQELRAGLHDADWFRAKPQSTNEPPEFLYRMMINAPENRRRFTIKGEHLSIEPIRAVLARASLRRLQPDLNRLPPPSAEEQRP